MTGKALLTVRQRDKNNICEEKQAEKNRSYPNLTTTSDWDGINVNGPTFLSLSRNPFFLHLSVSLTLFILYIHPS
ncbi:hypothetical protein JHK86_011861 [Glycine max]|nr:hypothetical protein JHK86_011861 [Glycine max]